MTTPLDPSAALHERLARIQKNLRSPDPGAQASAEEIKQQADQANLRTYALARVQAKQRQAHAPAWAAKLVQTHSGRGE